MYRVGITKQHRREMTGRDHHSQDALISLLCCCRCRRQGDLFKGFHGDVTCKSVRHFCVFVFGRSPIGTRSPTRRGRVFVCPQTSEVVFMDRASLDLHVFLVSLA